MPVMPGAHGSALPLARRAEALGLLGALALFVLLAGLRAWELPFPYYDDVAYLDTASRIHEAGGLSWLWRSLFDGSWTEDNRNPLYLGLLSIFAGRDLGFHVRAQALGIALGAAALVASWWTARRLFGQRAALWLALLLACSETLVAWSAREACEPLLLLFAALAFGQLLRDAPTRRALFLGGLFAGLAQLTKGTGIFIAICAVLALLAEAFRARDTLRPESLADGEHLGTSGSEASDGRDRGSASSGTGSSRGTERGSRAVVPVRASVAARFTSTGLRIGCVLAGVLLGGLPLFVRNLLRFRSPLHNVNDRFLWIDPLDDFSEIFAPGALARLDRGPLAYLRALTPGKAALRIGRGLGETLVHLGDSLSLVSPRPFGPVHIAWIAAGLVAAGISVRLIWRSPRGFQRTFLLVHAAFNFAFFAFYNAVSGSSRYLMPLSLSLLFPLARALGEAKESRSPAAADAGSAARGSSELAPAAGGAWGSRVLAPCAAAVLLTLALEPRTHQAAPDFVAAFDEVRAQVAPGEAFAIDARSRLQPAWAMDPRVRMETLSSSWDGQLLPAADLLAELRARQVRWVLLDGTSRKDAAPRWLFADALPLEADGSLSLSALPAGLRLVWLSPQTPHRYALLELR